MIESCLKRKIVFKFLKKYKQKKWNSIIPSLLEIAILNLYNSFKRAFFSEEDLSEIIQNLKTKKNNYEHNLCKEQKFNIEDDLDLDICDFSIKKRNSHSIFSKKAKNINELNIYTNYNIDNKTIHYYNKSSEISPIKRLINYSETEGSNQSNRFKKFRKLDKVLQGDNAKNKKNNNTSKNALINYNTIDISNTYRGKKTFFSNNNSIFLENTNNDKEYIKVNKIEKFQKLRSNKNSIEDINNSNKYLKENITEIKDKKDVIIKNSRTERLNNLNSENLCLTNFNKRKMNEQKDKNYKNINDFINKMPKHFYNKTANNSINHIHTQKDSEFNSAIRNRIIKNIYNKINIKKITMREIKKKQFSNIKKNILKDENDSKSKNKLINDDIKCDNIENIDDININSNLTSDTKKSKRKNNFELNKKKTNNIINYNSFNNDKNSKNKTFINDPYFFIKNNFNRKNLNK